MTLLRRACLAPLLLALACLSAAWGYGWPEGVLLGLEEYWQ
jgi:glucose-6-phosphate-specific signal transduction histidine kinase